MQQDALEERAFPVGAGIFDAIDSAGIFPTRLWHKLSAQVNLFLEHEIPIKIYGIRDVLTHDHTMLSMYSSSDYKCIRWQQSDWAKSVHLASGKNIRVQE